MIDPQNGYTAISKNALETLDLVSIYPRYGYLNDILMKLNIYNSRVESIQIPAKYGMEKSKIKYGNYIIKVSNLLLNNFIYRLKMKYFVLSFHPLVLFYMLGIILTPIGIFGGIFSLYYKYILGGDLFIRGTLSLLIFIIGIQFLLFAMLFDMQATPTETRYVLGDKSIDR